MKKRTEFAFMDNSLDVIRLFAALQVALTHYLNLTLLHYREPGMSDSFLLGLKRCLTLFPGVVILFSMSGFLLGAGLEKGTDRLIFLKKRCRRIYPELWLCIALTVIGLLVLLQPTAGERRSLFIWALIQGLGVSYTPGFLKEFGAGSINGALWTVMVEIQFYLLLFLFWNLLKKWKTKQWSLLLAFSVAANLFCYYAKEKQLLSGTVLSLLDRTLLPYLCWFVLGLWLYRMRKQAVPLMVRRLPFMIIVFVIYKGCWQYFGWKVPGYYADVVTGLLLPCLVIGAAYAFGRCRLKADLSYGIFLYHWLFINLVFYLELPTKMAHIPLFLGYTASFLLLAGMSWFVFYKKGKKA